MKKLRRIFTVILAIELLVLGLNYLPVKSANVVRAIGSLVVTFPSIPLFSETNWTPGSNSTKSFQIENTGLFGQTIGINAMNIIDESEPPLADAISIIISVNGVPVYGDGSATGHKHLTDFYNESFIVLSALGAGTMTEVSVSLQLHPDAGGEFEGLNTHFDIVIVSEQISNALPTLKPLPTLKGLQPLAPLVPFNIL